MTSDDKLSFQLIERFYTRGKTNLKHDLLLTCGRRRVLESEEEHGCLDGGYT